MVWYLFALCSAIMFAVTGILNKKILLHEHALEFTASRSIILSMLALILVPWVDFSISFMVHAIIAITALIVVAGVLFYMKSIRHGEISIIAPLMNISPLFLIVIAFFVLGEMPSTMQLIGIGLLAVGVYSLEVGTHHNDYLAPIKEFLRSKVIHFLMFALIIFSITATLDKLIVTKHTDVFTYLFFFTLYKTLFYLTLQTYRHGFREIINDFKKDGRLIITNGVTDFTGHILYMMAVAMPSAMIALVIAIKRTSSLFTTIFGGMLFHEKNLKIKITACTIMLMGAVLILW